MKIPSTAEYRHLWYLVPAFVLVYFMLPEHAYHDAGLERLAGAVTENQNRTEWSAVQMHALSDIWMAPSSTRRSANDILSGNLPADAVPGYRSFMLDEKALEDGHSQPARRVVEPAAGDSALFSFSDEESSPKVDFGRRGWLAESVLAAESEMEAFSQQVSPDLFDAVETDVFGRNHGLFDRSVEPSDDFWTGLFYEKDRDDDFPVQRRGIQEDTGESVSDSPLFSTGRSLQ